MLAASGRNIQSCTRLLEDNPGIWFPRFLASLGNVDTTEAHLLLQAIIDDLHPAAAEECCRIARRRSGVIFLTRHGG